MRVFCDSRIRLPFNIAKSDTPTSAHMALLLAQLNLCYRSTAAKELTPSFFWLRSNVSVVAGTGEPSSACASYTVYGGGCLILQANAALLLANPRPAQSTNSIPQIIIHPYGMRFMERLASSSIPESYNWPPFKSKINLSS